MSEIAQFLLTIIILIVSIMFIIIIIPPGATSVRARGWSALARWRRRSPSADADARRALCCERAAGGARYAPNAPHARADAAPTRADADGRSVTPALTQRPCASADGARRRRALR